MPSGHHLDEGKPLFMESRYADESNIMSTGIVF